MSIDLSDYRCTDEFFGAPYIDADQQNDQPYPYRYLHGGFAGTDTRFSMYFPAAEAWGGRLLTGLGGASGGDEGAPAAAVLMPGSALNGILMARVARACYTQSNQGHLGADMGGLKGDIRVMQFRADAETARLGKEIARQIYGRAPQAAYLYGGSGGGNRTLWGLEGVADVWQGGVAFMFGGSAFSAQLNAARLLRPSIDRVIDASRPGGGDPFAGLSGAQRDALAELYRMSFPRGGEFQLRFPMPEISWPAQVQMLELSRTDPTYVEDFWSDPAYAGADAAVRSELREFETTVGSVLTVGALAELSRGAGAPPGGIGLGLMVSMAGVAADPGDVLALRAPVEDPEALTCCKMTVLDGPAAGRSMYIMTVMGDLLIPGGHGAFIDLQLLRGLQPGARVQFSNRDFIAYCYRHRYEQSHDDGIGSAQFWVDDHPTQPQRPGRAGDHLGWTGAFNGKLILMQHLRDRPCWPSQAVAYERKVDRHLGEDRDRRFRLFWTEHATHVPVGRGGPQDTVLAIDYSGYIERGLLDMIAWVEEGVEPVPGTSYAWTRDCRVLLPGDAGQRRGLQPVVSLRADAAERAEVAVGQTVTLSMDAEAPAGAGEIVTVEWDFDGAGLWPERTRVEPGRTRLSAEVVHSYPGRGVYFPTVRVTAQRPGDPPDVAQLINIASCRVVVGPPAGS